MFYDPMSFIVRKTKVSRLLFTNNNNVECIKVDFIKPRYFDKDDYTEEELNEMEENRKREEREKKEEKEEKRQAHPEFEKECLTKKENKKYAKKIIEKLLNSGTCGSRQFASITKHLNKLLEQKNRSERYKYRAVQSMCKSFKKKKGVWVASQTRRARKEKSGARRNQVPCPLNSV